MIFLHHLISCLSEFRQNNAMTRMCRNFLLWYYLVFTRVIKTY
ncbi:hypothetical protein HMPREF9347_05229 [Escherichia coli MS 124-1]|uniref:Uncharacterized protein n=1 Tax=Escherichia coli MS 85-1 TaxID=679202 RepID=A0AAN3M5A0_ECOLX|nr:hypothetical protein HMPREF9347_05229 [Escherichia coli MS 124-1]EFU32929.1 hypothetical protein HMPREF9350_05229 [Escherichia coli MS 85-1]